MASLVNNCVFTAVAAGTGAFGMSAAVTGYQTPAAVGVVDTTKTYRYRAQSADLSQWEEGNTVSSGTATSFTRVVTASSAGGTTTVNFTNPPTVALTMMAADVLQFDDPMSLTAQQQAQGRSNLGVGAGYFSTGDAKLTFKTAADAGWILCDDGSIGDGSSGATTRANADTGPLFSVLYNITALVVQDSTGATVTRGANAAADFAAHRRLVIPKTLGRSIAIAGAGSGLTSRALGSTAGAETETPTLAKMFAHAHGLDFTPGGAYAGGGLTYGVNFPSSVSSTNTQGSSNPMNILDPSTYLNVMIML